MAWEFEDLSVNQPQQDNSPAQRWEFEDVNVPSQTVLDDDSGEVYAVPVSFDERDTRFAIETQTKGADILFWIRSTSRFGRTNMSL